MEKEKKAGKWIFIKVYLGAGLALVPLWKILKMNPWTVFAVGVFLACMLPIHFKKYKESKRQEKRLEEVSQYMDAMLYAFQKEGKIYNSLEDVYDSLADGPMREIVGQTRAYVEMTYDEIDVMERGLAKIYQAYPARRIRNLHEFMLHVENYGGNLSLPVELLLKEKEMWELRMKQILAERNKMFRDVILSIVTSVEICATILYLPAMNMDLSQNPISQILTFALLALDDFILLRAQDYLAKDWISLEADQEDSYYEKKMHDWKNWEEKKEQRLSLILGSIMSVLTVTAFVLKHFWLGCLGILLSVFGFLQHKIGHRLMGQKVSKEVVRAFPVWLMDLVLLLQSENVQNALQKSLEHAPGVLREELLNLLDQLEMDPENARPYHQFLASFSIPEVHSSMNLLYAMSMGQGGSVDQQIGNLIRRNQEMQNMAEKQQDQDRTSGLYLLFLAPVLTGSLKLLVDMALFMMAFLSSTM